MSEEQEQQEVIERRTAVLTRKVKEISKGKDEMFLALVEASQAQIALEEIRLALIDSPAISIPEDDYESIVAYTIEAIVEYRVNRETYYRTENEPFVENGPTTFTTYDAQRLRYLVDDDD